MPENAATNSEPEVDRQQGQAFGVDGYLVKPLDEEKLLSVSEKLGNSSEPKQTRITRNGIIRLLYPSHPIASAAHLATSTSGKLKTSYQIAHRVIQEYYFTLPYEATGLLTRKDAQV